MYSLSSIFESAEYILSLLTGVILSRINSKILSFLAGKSKSFKIWPISVLWHGFYWILKEFQILEVKLVKSLVYFDAYHKNILMLLLVIKIKFLALILYRHFSFRFISKLVYSKSSTWACKTIWVNEKISLISRKFLRYQ